MKYNRVAISKTLEQASQLSLSASSDVELLRIIKVTTEILDYHKKIREPECLVPEDIWK